jgi:hypothetical protein
MLQGKFTLIQNELNHDTGDQGQSDCGHKDEVEGASCFLDVLELLIDRVRCGCHIEIEVSVITSNSENGLVDVLGVESRDILRSDVKVVDDVVEVGPRVRLEDLV